MSKLTSAGLLMCRITDGELEFFLVHPGGPFFKNKDAGAWSIPKGLPDEEEELLHTATREFREETGLIPSPPYFELPTIKQKSGKTVYAWTFIGAWDPEKGIKSNTFSLEWPPRSGKFQEFPEQDHAAWMRMERARIAINPAQIPLLDAAQKIHMG